MKAQRLDAIIRIERLSVNSSEILHVFSINLVKVEKEHTGERTELSFY
jgi:hypothetical protein